MQSQVQGECEYGASFEHEGRLLWKSRLPRWGQSFASMTRGIIRAQTNVQQILGVMHQDGLPKRAIRTARWLLLVYRDESEKRCRTRGRPRLVRQLDGTQAQCLFKRVRRFSAVADALTGSALEAC